MDGICAIIGNNAEQLIKNICENLRHRGPDDEGYFIDEDLALGHRALKIDNIPILHQPLTNEDKTIWITFDGKIYNKKRLIQQIEKNHTFHTNSSAEVVVHYYEDYGFNCLNMFNGMFAYCLWDSRNKLLFSVRDRLGLKPLYYYNGQDRFILSSEIKGIFTDITVPRKPNNRIIYEYLEKGARGSRAFASKTGETFFLGIKELLPSHYMVIDKSGSKIKRYWQIRHDTKSNLSNMDDHWCASEFQKLLQDSIKLRIPANLSFGTFLSGGLDSTTIAFLIDEFLKRKNSKPESLNQQELFSAIYKEPVEQGDEKSYLKEIERVLKTKVNYIFPSVKGEWENIKQFIYYIEEPVGVFNYYVYWSLFQAAKQKVKIIFHGQGPDEILGGHTGHALIYLTELWKRKKFGMLLKELIKSLDWFLPYWIRSFWFKRNAKSKAEMLLASHFVEAYSQSEMQKEDVSIEEALFSDTTQLLVEHLRVEDRASSAFSMECRHPFLDHKIVEFAFSLPATQKIRNGWTKYVLRNAVKSVIPETIRRRRKKFATPIPHQRWMKELRQDIRKLFESYKFRERGYFNQHVILEVFDRYCEGRMSQVERLYYAGVLWRIINLELWLETFSLKE